MKRILGVVALVLLFAGNAVAQGPNASAVVSFEVDASDNKTDDSIISGTVAGAGTDITLEIFVTGTAGSVIGGEVVFDNDPTQLKVKALDAASPTTSGLVVPAGLFGLGTTDTSATIGGFPPGVSLANGFFGTVRFETVADLTGVEFTLGIKSLTIVDGTTTTPDDLTLATVLSFNSSPKVVSSVSAPVTIPRGSDASATVTAAGFAADATITFTVTQTGGSATISDVASATSVVVTASGSGSATVDVTASDGTTTTDAVQLVFSEQVPVELSAFGGQLVDDRVVLNWTTASQTNNAGWRVLRSVDSENYEVVSEVLPGAGTTDALLSYDFTDKSLPSAGAAFYVLEQIDLDGTVHRSNTVEVLLGARFQDLPTEFASNAYPNPFNPSTTISYDLPSDGLVSIVIYDALGQEVRNLVQAQHTAGRYSLQWDAKDMLGHSVGSGVYIAKIRAGQFSSSQKMLLLK